jgi:2-polyprenyl-3-methyl-5-hydroxy-6-metoxy-1,4-benzoquinol methylase
VEKVELPFERGHFDCILYGDVLEHLINPWQVLKEHRSFLRNGGAIICSIPNIRHYRVIRRLVFRGKWEYTDSGILDRTHLRFFTLGSIQKMLEEAGFEIKGMVKRPSAPVWLKLLNHMLGGRLIDFLVRRYIIVAFMKEEEKSVR